ncbi:MAG: DNA polymerase III subunit alpha [Desulfobacterales bacterium]|nr:DNA polymerase III subunit alpha [Desulfobacterales bacterium]
MIPLTVRSHYSLMQGAAPVRQLCRAARQMGYDRLALTDTDNLYGLWPFLAACRREGIRPIVGAEVRDPGRAQRGVCLVEDGQGYRNLCRLLTRRHLDPAFRLETALPPLARGLTVLTSDPGLLASWHGAGVRVAAAMPRRPLAAVHPLRRAAARTGVPVVAVPDSVGLVPGDLARHRLLRAVAGKTTLARLASGESAPADAWLAPPQMYAQRFASCPQALTATHALAERLTFTGPAFGIVMPPWSDRRGRPAAEALRAAAYRGAARRYGRELPEPVVERLEHELRIVAEMGFSAYFLVVQDIVRHSPRTCGRGSGAASLIAYSLGITNVCPLKHNLYFERFLNPGRSDPPDIDVDFAWDERDDVQLAVLSRFKGHAAMVCNHVLFQPRLAVRETAKAYGLSESEIARVTRRLPWYWRVETPATELLTAVQARPEARALDFPPPWPEILSRAQALIGTPRHLAVHSGGVVITPDPIDTYVPVERAPKGVPVIQWEKDATEDAGLVKIDLLGNRSLGVIRDAVANVRANGDALDETCWAPEDDFATQQAVGQGQTMGCFYIESPAMRLLQQKAGVGDFGHLVIHSSIIRPAANEFIQEYLRRLHGAPWDPIHPLLADVLDETFGIMVYQEDVSRTAVALAGFSHAEADRLRKVMSKKDRAFHLEDFRTRFFAGARARRIPLETARAVWDMIMSFSGYSFCKPHSASYAQVSFQAAYLKVHHPAAFMAAVISNQGGFYSTFAYVSEARRLGLTIRPPDVNRSEVRWHGRSRSLRVGLQAVKGLSAATRERLVAARRRDAFQDTEDFLQRARPDEAEARALIYAGALDGLAPGTSRAGLMWLLARWQRRREKAARQGLLFAPPPERGYPAFPPDDPLTRRRREFAVLGFLCDRHPMSLYQAVRENAGTVKAAAIAGCRGRRVRFAGWLVTGKVVHTKHGEPMEFLTFEDETGIVETTFFPAVYHRFCHMLDGGRPYLLKGRVEQDWGAVTLTVDWVAPLPPLRAVAPEDGAFQGRGIDEKTAISAMRAAQEIKRRPAGFGFELTGTGKSVG